MNISERNVTSVRLSPGAVKASGVAAAVAQPASPAPSRGGSKAVQPIMKGAGQWRDHEHRLQGRRQQVLILSQGAVGAFECIGNT